MIPFCIDDRVTLTGMARLQTLPPGEEGVDWYWDTKTCSPRIKKTCEVCGEQAFMRQKQLTCSHACGVARAKQTRPDYHGENNPKWRGENAKYLARHVRVRAARGSASECTCTCGAPAFEWAHVHDTDPFDVSNYQAMCVKCHREYDKPMAVRAEDHPKTHLTWSDVRSIRAQRGKKQKDLAAEFGITQATVSKIQRGSVWKEGGDALCQ